MANIRTQVPPDAAPRAKGAISCPQTLDDDVLVAVHHGVGAGAGHLIGQYHLWNRLDEIFNSIGRLATIPFGTFRRLDLKRKPADPDQRWVNGEVIDAKYLKIYREDKIPEKHLERMRQHIITRGVDNDVYIDVYATLETMEMPLPIRDIMHPILGRLSISAMRLHVPADIQSIVVNQMVPILTARCIHVLIAHLELPNPMIIDDEGVKRRRELEEIDISPNVTGKVSSVAVTFTADDVDAQFYTLYACFLNKHQVELLRKQPTTLGPSYNSEIFASFAAACSLHEDNKE